MLIIWKDNTRTEAIVYKGDGGPGVISNSAAVTVAIFEAETDPNEDSIVQAIHLPGFDGPWPTQERLDHAYEHRYDFLKDIKWMMLNCETGKIEELNKQ